jgi:hypothetical protein
MLQTPTLGLADLRDRYQVAETAWIAILKPNGTITLHSTSRRGRRNADRSPQIDRLLITGVSAAEARIKAHRKWTNPTHSNQES